MIMSHLSTHPEPSLDPPGTVLGGSFRPGTHEHAGNVQTVLVVHIQGLTAIPSGVFPTGTVAITAFVDPSITDTSLLAEFAT